MPTIVLSNDDFIAKLYILSNTVDDKFYIGSTRESLAQRMALHKNDVRRNKQSDLYKHMATTGVQNWGIKLLEQHLCSSSNEQFKAERLVLDQYKDNPNCLNMNQCYVSPAEKVIKRKQRLSLVRQNKKYHCAYCNTTMVCGSALGKHNNSVKHIRAFVAY